MILTALLTLLCLLIPTTALASTDPTPTGLIDMIVGAFQAGQIWVGIGLALMLLTIGAKWVIERFRDEIPPARMPWIAAIIGTVGALGLTLSSGLLWWKALISGPVGGAVSSGLWSLVGKHFLRSRKQKDERAMAREAAAAALREGGAS